MKRDVTDIAASVHHRLLNIARETHRPFGEVLQYYAMERFLYRLSCSPDAERFILKGALVVLAWHGPATRSTRDIDLLGKIDNSIEHITRVMGEACRQDVIPDGMNFDAGSIEAEHITELAAYEGVRVRFWGNLGNARVRIQVDIGFGDVVIPEPQNISYPTIMDLPAPTLKGYTRESVIAEKFEAMVKLGVINSRMKDFYDIWFLSRWFPFDGMVLARALRETFAKRETALPAIPEVLHTSFATGDKETQWKAFLHKSNLTDTPRAFAEIHAALAVFLMPVCAASADAQDFHRQWHFPGPWQ
jgi:hypothetical protein